MDRLFLDANVLFSAAYREDSGLARLWALEDVELVSSAYAVEEARRNLDTDEQRSRLDLLCRNVRVVQETRNPRIPPDISLSEKDRPILAAALESGATHLITGDRRDFGHLLGRRIEGTLLLLPRDYLQAR